MSSLIGRTLEYHYGPTRMLGHLVVNSTNLGRRPGVLVVPDGFGLGPHTIASAERLASLGYAALAIDLWGEGASITELPKMMELIGQFAGDRTMWMGHVDAARDALVDQENVDKTNIAAIGYCFGGTTVLEYARKSSPIRAAISFHGGLEVIGADWDGSKTSAKLLICTGADDPLINLKAVMEFSETLTKAGVTWETDIYSGAKHAFTNPHADQAGMPQALAYNERADRRSWDSATRFLSDAFKA